MTNLEKLNITLEQVHAALKGKTFHDYRNIRVEIIDALIATGTNQLAANVWWSKIVLTRLAKQFNYEPPKSTDPVATKHRLERKRLKEFMRKHITSKT
jgi:hypothetical protein